MALATSSLFLYSSGNSDYHLLEQPIPVPNHPFFVEKNPQTLSPANFGSSYTMRHLPYAEAKRTRSTPAITDYILYITK